MVSTNTFVGIADSLQHAGIGIEVVVVAPGSLPSLVIGYCA